MVTGFLHAQTASSRITGTIDSKSLTTIPGSVHPQANARNDQGVASGTLSMKRMVLVLKRSEEQEAALKKAIAAMHDPASSQYHKWLTPDQFGSAYGPTLEDIGKINAWLTSQGFQIDRVARGRGTIEFSGTAAAVNNAFHTSIHSYKVNGKQHFANATAPKIPTAITPVVAGILSLHNFEKSPSTKLLGKLTAADLKSVTSKSQLTYTPYFSNAGTNYTGPGDLWTIYNATPVIQASPAIDGSGQTIALSARSEINANDVAGFRASLLPSAYSSASVFSQVFDGPTPGIVSGDDVESTLDVEYAMAMAPGANVVLVVAGSTNSTDGIDLSASYTVDNNLASVVSTSYGSCEALMGTGNAFYNSLWEQAAAQGITSLVSSGDNGSAGCDIVGPSGDESMAYVADEGLQVSGLASTPYNIAVGGNMFSDDSSTYWTSSSSSSTSPAPLTSARSYIPEKVWNESCSPTECGNANANLAAGSGGASGCFNATWDSTGTYILSCKDGYAAPNWQSLVYGSPTDGKRHIPDVSLTASSHDGYMVCYNDSCDSSSFYVVGGTSASSPAMAGIIALVNQKTGSRQGQANSILYQLAASQYGTPDSPNSATLANCNASNGNSTPSSCIFHDVTAGTNAVPCNGGTLNCSATQQGTYGTLTAYAAKSGYDSATGLGSVNVANLVNHWSDISQGATTTTLSLGSNSSTYGSPLAINVSVAPQSGSGTPTGDVALMTDSTTGSAVAGGTVQLANGNYSGTINTLPGGTYNVKARYAGDTTYASSVSSASALTVNPASSSTTLTITGYDPITGAVLSGNSLPYGSNIGGKVSLAGVSGLAAPTGTVSVLEGTETLATLAASSDGTLSFVASGAERGTFSWVAGYNGDGNYLPSQSSAVAFSVVQAPTSLHLNASTSYVVGSGNISVTATVVTSSKMANPTGSVTLLLNGTSVGSTATSTFTNAATGASEAKAAFSVPATSLAAGSNTFTATYDGDANYTGSTAAGITVGYSTTNPANAIALAASATAVTSGTPVTLTATVTTGGIPAVSGTVEFFDGTASLGTAQVVGNAPATGYTTGTATLKRLFSLGEHSIKAVYKGISAAPAAVTSSAVTITSTGTLSSSIALEAAASSTTDGYYDFTATVSGYGLTAPTGTVKLNESTVAADLGTLSFVQAAPLHTLTTPAYYSAADPIGARPIQSVVADFNGDGIPDIATGNASFSGGNISVLLGKGDGTFGAATTYATQGTFVSAIVTGDFNNDGILDIAVASNYGANFSFGVADVFLGNGDGTFQASTKYQFAGYANSITVADFNNDGLLDIAVADYYPAQLEVAYGNGDGTFNTDTKYTISVSSDFVQPYALRAADLNGDGLADLVEVNVSSNNFLAYLNNGDGTFSVSANVSVHYPEGFALADLNKDGKVDMIVSNYGDQTASVALGNGDGTFQAPVTYPLAGYASTLEVADMDGDGNPDLVAGYFYPAIGVGILKGNGDGTLNAGTVYATGQGHGYGVTVADLNGDGALDLISSDINSGDSASQGIAVLMNVTQAKATASSIPVYGSASATQQVQAVYSGNTTYTASASNTLSLAGSGKSATPAISWTPQSPWGAGVALGGSVLNATVNSSIAGSFAYTAQTGSSSAVAVNAASTLTAGTYTFTATFTPLDTTSYTTATATRTVVIQQADFSVTSSSKSLTITAGQSGSFTISVPALFGFTGNVTLAGGSSLPGGFKVTASPATVAADGTSTITIATTGLGGVTPAVRSHGLWLVGVGMLLAGAVVLPFGGRRYKMLTAVLVLIATLGVIASCGGTGYGTTTLSLATSSNKVASGTSVTFTTTVSNGRAKPSGTVTFFNGSTALGTATVTDGTATFSTSSLPVGLNSITASYSGDAHNSSATSSAVSELITGTVPVQIVGTSGALAHSMTVNVTLQ